MTEIVSEIVEILKSSNDLLEAELKILRLFSSLLCEVLGTSLEQCMCQVSLGSSKN
ncbi:MAG: hypothetical protein ABF991_14280 [Liquorilactobacillus hordei]|uniref:hypothetical protein n=1 Tax=Liquorilactobacillus TaxID=2767888 RepID=UPI0039ECD87F